MAQRPDILTISLGPEADRHKASLRALALLLDLPGRKANGSLSELMILIAETAEAAMSETVALLEAARNRAAGGDEWSTLAILHELLPDFTLVSGG